MTGNEKDNTKAKINGFFAGFGYESTTNVFDVRTTQPKLTVGGEFNGKSGNFTIGADVGSKNVSPYVDFNANVFSIHNGNHHMNFTAGAGVRGRFDYNDSQIIKTTPGEKVYTDSFGNSTWTKVGNKNTSETNVIINFNVPNANNGENGVSAANSSITPYSIVANTDETTLDNTYKHREFSAQTNFTGEYHNPKVGISASTGIGLNVQKDFNPDMNYVVEKGTQSGKTSIEYNGKLYETPTPLKITEEKVGAHNLKIFPSLNMGVEQRLLSFGKNKKGVVNVYAKTEIPLNNLHCSNFEIGSRIGF